MNKTEDYSEILKELKLKHIPLYRTKKPSWKNDLDDLIGNYSMFTEPYEGNPKYTWADVIYSFVDFKLKTIEERAREETIKELTENALNKTQPDYQFYGKARKSLTDSEK